MRNTKLTLALIFLAIIITSLIAVFIVNYNKNRNKITNFEECVTAGGIVQESFPAKCKYKGKEFTQDISEIQQREQNDL